LTNDDPKAELFRLAVKVLKCKSARAIIGQQLKSHPLDKLLNCLRTVEKADPLHPISYFKGVLNNYQNKPQPAPVLDLSRFIEERK